MRARVVVAVDEVDLREPRQGRLHLLARVRARATACRPRTRPRGPGCAPRRCPPGSRCAGPGRGSRSSAPRARRSCPCRRGSCAIHSPAARPICLLSAPMKQVNLSPSTARSSTMTGMPASNAWATGCVSGAASLGLMMMRSTLCADELLHVRALHERVVLRVLEDDLEVRVRGGRVLDVGVHLRAPGLAQVALAHADHAPLLGAGGRGEPPSASARQPHRGQRHRHLLRADDGGPGRIICPFSGPGASAGRARPRR